MIQPDSTTRVVQKSVHSEYPCLLFVIFTGELLAGSLLICKICLSDCLEEKLLILLRDIATGKESTRLCQQLLNISCSFSAIGCSCALNVWCLFKSIVGIYNLIIA